MYGLYRKQRTCKVGEVHSNLKNFSKGAYEFINVPKSPIFRFQYLSILPKVNVREGEPRHSGAWELQKEFSDFIRKWPQSSWKFICKCKKKQTLKTLLHEFHDVRGTH